MEGVTYDATNVEQMISEYTAGAGFASNDDASSAENNAPGERQANAGVRLRGLTAPAMLRDACRAEAMTDAGILLIYDEIQCGLGRTGRIIREIFPLLLLLGLYAELDVLNAGNPRIYGQLVPILGKYSKFASAGDKAAVRQAASADAPSGAEVDVATDAEPGATEAAPQADAAKSEDAPF